MYLYFSSDLKKKNSHASLKMPCNKYLFFSFGTGRVLRHPRAIHPEVTQAEFDARSLESTYVLKNLKFYKKSKAKHRGLRLRGIIGATCGMFFNKKLTVVGVNCGARKHIVQKLYVFSKALYRRYRVFKRLRDCHLLLCAVIASLRFKDATILTPIIKRMFEGIHYSKHRFVYYFWRYVIHMLLPRLFTSYVVGGLKLEFHGKLGVGGNSKKRSYYFKRGLGSNSTKFLKLDTASGQIRTDTGVVGFTYSVFY